MEQTDLSLQLKTLPNNPGVYQYYDAKGNIIYVGKAKNLKKRVNSYFTKTHDNHRTRLLVRNIVNIEHIVVESEMDALLLENNLIKAQTALQRVVERRQNLPLDLYQKRTLSAYFCHPKNHQRRL